MTLRRRELPLHPAAPCYSQDVRLARRELVVHRVLDVHNVEAAVVALAVRHHADTALPRQPREPCCVAPRLTMLRPPVTMAITPVSNLMNSVILPVARSILTVSFFLMSGSG